MSKRIIQVPILNLIKSRLPVATNYELREDGGKELRENNGIEERE